MKRIYGMLLPFLTLFALASCGKSTINQKETYEDICSLCDGYESDHVSYTSVLTSEERNLTLTNEGELTKNEDAYTYTYSYQYLNKVGSGASSLISEEKGTITGTKEEITTEGFTASEDYKVLALNLADSFKTYKITEENDSYVMRGYIARNTIIKNTSNLDDDIRFNYELTTDKEVKEIKSLVITYVTVRFDSVVITITY